MSYIDFRHFYGRTTAYTEDNVEIRRLFLHRVSFRITAETLRDYFDIFGKVLHLELFEKRGKNKFQIGNVLFESAQDAANVLAKQLHSVNEQIIKVEPYHSWGQPAVEDFQPVSPTAPIMRLNDDCLIVLYRYLGLADQLNLARALQRCPPLYSCINVAVFKELSLWDMRDFFQLFGQQLRQIVGQIPRMRHQRLIEFVGAHCRRLKLLRISSSHLSVSNMHKLFVHLRQLEELELPHCDLNDDCLTALCGLSRLRKLNLSYNDMLTGCLMDALPQTIESLNLLYCIDVQLKLLPSICSCLPQLRQLAINEVQGNLTSVLQQLVDDHCCDQLEALTLVLSTNPDRSQQLDALARLPRLQQLILHNNTPSCSLLQQLVQHKSQQLQHLEINSYIALTVEQLALISELAALRFLCVSHNNGIDDAVMGQLCRLQQLEHIDLRSCKQVSDQAVLQLLLRCSKLHVLQLQRCRLLTEQLVHRIIRQLNDLISSGLNRRQLPVKLFFGAGAFSDSLFVHPNIAAQDVVDIKVAQCNHW